MDMRHKKLSLLQDLIALSKADGVESDMEVHFINTVATNLGVSEADLNHLKENPINYNPEDKETDRIIQFYRLILLMGVDQDRHEKEIKFCKEAGLKMGLNTTGINTTLEKIAQSKTGTLAPTDIIKIFQTYHN